MKKFTPEEKKKLDDFDGSMYGDPSTWGKTVGEYISEKGHFEKVYDNITKDKPKTKRQILDEAYANGYIEPSQVDFSERISNDHLLNEIKDHNDVKYNKHTGRFEDGSGQVYSLKEASIQNYKNFRKHKSHGFKKVKNANNRSRDLLREQRKYLGWDKKGMMSDTLVSEIVNSGASQEEKIKLANVKNYHSDLNELSDTAPDNPNEFDLKAYIKQRADQKIREENEDLRKRYGTKGLGALGVWNYDED